MLVIGSVLLVVLVASVPYVVTRQLGIPFKRPEEDLHLSAGLFSQKTRDYSSGPIQDGVFGEGPPTVG
jgi:hypothetical protein